MSKPVAYQASPRYDFHECRDHLISLGYSATTMRNFWHWMCDALEMHNGSEITFSRETLQYYKDFDSKMPYYKDFDSKMSEIDREIYQKFLDEFADDDGEVLFWVEW
jgi:hypothetical protein